MISRITICRHAVQTASNGLSEFQNQLLHNKSLIRFAEAPAGCGKSYAFLRAVLDGKRILFVVPTRRLAMNLIASLQKDMSEEGWSDADIQKKISVWSSDGRIAMKAMGIKNVTQKRLHEVFELSPHEGGEIIVTTPESLAWLVLDPARYPEQGVNDASVLDIITNFDHLVFDEMHTIEKRGLSLSFILGWMCTQFSECSTHLTYLSATPIDLSRPFEMFGFKPNDIAYLSETITDLTKNNQINRMRVIHGDVKISCYENLSLSDLLRLNTDKVLREIDAGRQVILIFDQLFNGLSRSLPVLANILSEIGLSPEQALLISSVDDSQKGDADYLGFTMGAQHDPKKFPILIATSSIEIGVTFQCRLLFMEPGYSAASLVQRIGRVSRGDYSGEIFISVQTQNLGRHLWLKQFLAWMKIHHEKTVSIKNLTLNLCKSLRIHPTVSNSFQHNVISYGAMPEQAAAIAGLYWEYMLKHVGLKNARRNLLLNKHPAITLVAKRWLAPIRLLLQEPMYADAAKYWLKMFETEIKTLRTMPKTVVVRTFGGKSQWILPILLVRRNTNLLDLYEPTENEYGQSELWIDEVHWRNGLADEKKAVTDIKYLCLPHTLNEFPIKFRAKSELKTVLKEELNGYHPKSVKQALEAVKLLSNLTGLFCVK